MKKTRTHTRKIVTFIASLAMMATLLTPTFAIAADGIPEPPYKIEIVPNENSLVPDETDSGANETLKARFNAYTIFAGKLNNKYDGTTSSQPNANYLEVTGWGNGVKQDDASLKALLIALMTDRTNLQTDLGISPATLGDSYNTKGGQGVNGFKVDENTTLGNMFRQALRMNGYTISYGSDLTTPTNITGRDLTESAPFIAKVIADLNAASVENNGNNSALANAFATILANNETLLDEPITSKWEKDHWEIETNQAGYYLILDKHKSTDNSQAAISEYMLAVFGSQAINMKSSIPTVKKNIITVAENGDPINPRKTDNVSVGDTVTFQLTSTLPENFDNYTEYFYRFHDELSDGLEFDRNSLRIYAVDQTGNANNWYLLEDRSADSQNTDGSGYIVIDNLTHNGYDQDSEYKNYNCTFDIQFSNLKNLKGKLVRELSGWLPEGSYQDYPDLGENMLTSDWTFIIMYDAVVTEEAVVVNPNDYDVIPDNNTEDDRNMNTIELEFSNDVHNDSHGKTPEDKVYVYTYGLDIDKIDGTTKESMAGVPFSLSMTDENKQVKYAVFTLKPRTSSVDTGSGNVDITIQEYTIFDWITKDQFETLKQNSGWENGLDAEVIKSQIALDWATGKYYIAAVTVDTVSINGTRQELQIKGLDGNIQYTLIEEAAPVGYDTMAKIVFTIEPQIDPVTHDLKGININSSKRNDVVFPETVSTGFVPVTLANMPSGYLPGTGGMGTALFYTGGIIMLASGGVHVYRRKRLTE